MVSAPLPLLGWAPPSIPPCWDQRGDVGRAVRADLGLVSPLSLWGTGTHSDTGALLELMCTQEKVSS